MEDRDDPFCTTSLLLCAFADTLPYWRVRAWAPVGDGPPGGNTNGAPGFVLREHVSAPPAASHRVSGAVVGGVR